MIRSKHLVVFGTRPEAIKMAPVVKSLKKCELFDVKVCVTAQHREMLDQVLDFFEIRPDYDLNLMKPDQNLFTLTADIVTGMKSVLDEFQPNYLYVHGDTTTSMAAGIAGFYAGAKVCHVEAGLRTNNKYAPFPEELNRQLTGRIADIHFAPTNQAKVNLLNENVNEEAILVTGNTVIDALLDSVKKVQEIDSKEINLLRSIISTSKTIVLVTGHRRENHGHGFIEICEALKEIASTNENVEIVYPVHLNPNVQKPVNKLLANIENVKLIAPLSYPAFVWLMSKSSFVITDSGGVQEEAPSLGKPVLVMRDTTERPEAVAAGTVILVGAHKSIIVKQADKLIKDSAFYKEMSGKHNPYGDGKASDRIAKYMMSVCSKI